MKKILTPLCLQNLVDGKLKPRVWDTASVVCVDIVGFTKMSGTMQADRLCVMLSVFYERLDTLAEAHNVYKVDIIGDAYVALGMCAEDAVRFCLNASAMAKTIEWDDEDASRGCVSIRCAVHTGKVIGIVLDTVCFKYTLVGETALVAKQLECAALPGQVHCSAETVAYLDAAEFRMMPTQLEKPCTYIVVWATDVECLKPAKSISVPDAKPFARAVRSVVQATKKKVIATNPIPLHIRLHNLELKN